MKHTAMKNVIKLPNNVRVICFNHRNLLVVWGFLGKKIIHLKVRVWFGKKNILKVTSLPLRWISKKSSKKLKALQGTTVVLIQNLIKESNIIFYKRLKFIGVGYRAFNLLELDKNILKLKLGYSHNVFFKVMAQVNVFCLKLTNMFIYGNFYQHICQIAGQIRLYKKPEPYKGKGIRFFNEHIELKASKKT